MSHEGIKELLAAHALDALDAATGREVEQHLLSCAECRAELEAWRETVAALAYAVAPVAPAPDTRTRLLLVLKAEATVTHPVAADARINATNGGGNHGADNEADAPDDSTRADSTASNVVPFRTAAERNASRRGSSSWLRFGALAACIALAVVAVALGSLWQRARHTNVELARVAGELRTAQSELDRVRADRDLLAAAEARTATLAAAPNGSGSSTGQRARARLTYDEATGRALLVAADLPPVPTGKAYQLWFIAEGKPLPGSVFTTDGSGHGEMHDIIPPEGRRAAAVIYAVTLEPAGGVSAPTGEIYLKSSAS